MLTPFQERAASALKETPFFGELDARALGRVHRVAVPRGELLFSKGEPSTHLYAVISGQLKVFSAPTEDREISLELVAPGELVGELGVDQGGPRVASVKALAPTELAAISRCTLAPLLEAQPDLRASLGLATLAAATRLAERAEDTAFLSIEERIDKALDDFARRFGEAVENGVRVRLRQQDLADLLGVSRETVSRAFATPGMRRRLALGRGSVTLLR